MAESNWMSLSLIEYVHVDGVVSANLEARHLCGTIVVMKSVNALEDVKMHLEWTEGNDEMMPKITVMAHRYNGQTCTICTSQKQMWHDLSASRFAQHHRDREGELLHRCYFHPHPLIRC